MKEIKINTLTPRQKEEIEELINECRIAHPVRVSFPYEDADLFFLLCDTESDKPKLVSALALIMPRNPDSDEPAECAAFTRPSCRQKGYFRRLFDSASEYFSELDLILMADGSEDGDPAALKALDALGAEPVGNEYRMECELTKLKLPLTGIRQTSENPRETNRLSCTVTEEENKSLCYTFYLKEETAAVCRTVGDPPAACFFDFSVREDLRGRGLGLEALTFVMQYLRKNGYSRIFLHVSGDNGAAVSLYKKTGFRVAEILSCYLY